MNIGRIDENIDSLVGGQPTIPQVLQACGGVDVHWTDEAFCAGPFEILHGLLYSRLSTAGRHHDGSSPIQGFRNGKTNTAGSSKDHGHFPAQIKLVFWLFGHETPGRKADLEQPSLYDCLSAVCFDQCPLPETVRKGP